MKFPITLTYKKDTGTSQYYHISTAKEGKISAEVLIVPGKMLDVHISNDTKLPLMGCAMSKNHPDHLFTETDMKGKNIILIRDEVYRLANKEEMQALVEHEFGHILHGDVTASDTCYDKAEVLADAFIEHPEHTKSLEKKWTCHIHKNCQRCKTKMIMDNETVENHWFLYCPSCGFWMSDGSLSMFYIENLVCKRVGKKPREIPKYLQFLAEQPVLSYDQNVVLEKVIAEGKKMYKNNKFYNKS